MSGSTRTLDRSRNRGGRPRADEPGSTLSIWIPAKDHDYYARLAARRGESISKTVGLLHKTFGTPTGKPPGA
jgi:hypothetical protein